jgi:uncharacterized membrane protein YphA (DoxX/SURF4 family)
MFLRNISILGGLLLCLSEHLIKSSKSKNSVFASIPTLSPVERHQYFQLAGRILLMVLFLGMIISSRWTVASLVASLFSFAACVMIIVGFRAKWSASLLVSFLCVMNLLVNNWWSIDHASFRDSAKYNFFQTLSIMGGFLLLIVIGPGHLSYDEKKKDH